MKIIFFLLIIIIYLIFQIAIYKIEKINLLSFKIKGNLKIVHISDYHLNKFINLNKFRKDIKKFEPDFIFLTGDMIRRNTKQFKRLEKFLKIFKNYNTYYVDGNHECENKKAYKVYELLDENNIIDLSDKKISLNYKNNNISLYGKGFYSSYNEELIDESYYNIFLVHNPNDFLKNPKAYDLALSGHKHGGQVRFPFLGQIIDHGFVFFPKYSKGIYNFGDTNLYIDSGLGQSFNLRIMCRVSFTEIIIN